MERQILTTTTLLTRRDFISTTGAAWAASFVPIAWSSGISDPPRLARRPWAEPHIDRYRSNVEGFWRTHTWVSNGGVQRLQLSPLGTDDEADWGSAPVQQGFIQLSRAGSAMPQQIRYNELSCGIGLADIQRDFGEGVLQELLEEIRFRI